MNSEFLKLGRRGPVLYVGLNRPDRLNALTPQMSRDLLAFFRQVNDDEATRVVVLYGEGRGFCAGGDLSVELDFTAESFRREMRLFADTALAILDCRKTIICQINGDAIGWGATFALFCDVTVADEKARIGDPHVNVGLSTGDGASVIWPQLVGFARARKLLLTGEPITGAVAAQYGLVSEAVPTGQLRERVDALADLIASKPPVAVEMTKASINLPLKDLVKTYMEAYMEFEAQSQQAPGHRAAVEAFLERKRARSQPNQQEKFK